MQLIVKGSAGTNVEAAMIVSPYPGTTITKREKGPAKRLKPSAEYQTVGTVPCAVTLKYRFYARPWSLNFEARAGIEIAPFVIASTDLHLPEIELQDPDVLEFTIKAEEKDNE